MDADWIAHDGMGCTLAVGTRYEAIHRDGVKTRHVVCELAARRDVFKYKGGLAISSWAWGLFLDNRARDEENDILSYRILGKSEDERREDYQALFDSWKRVDKVIAPPVKVPEKVGGDA